MTKTKFKLEVGLRFVYAPSGDIYDITDCNNFFCTCKNMKTDAEIRLTKERVIHSLKIMRDKGIEL